MSKGTVNKAILVGRLGRDPEMRYTSSGTAVVNFSIATNHFVKDQSGNNNDQTEWHNIVAFGKTAEIASEYLTKGRLVFIEGRLQTRKWQDQNGADRYSTEINAHEMQMLGSKQQAGHDNTDHRQRPHEQAAPAQQEAPLDRNGQSTAPMDDGFDDIPF